MFAVKTTTARKAKPTTKVAKSKATPTATKAVRTKREPRIVPLKVDAATAKKVATARNKGVKLAALKAELGIGWTRLALYELIRVTPTVSYKDQADLTKKIVSDRKGGASWGVIMARYQISESTARRLYAEAGNTTNDLDFRKGPRARTVAKRAAQTA